MLERLPERYQTRAVFRAVTAPSAVLLAGAGAAAAVLGGLPIAAAAGVGALAWGARVALALPRRRREDRIAPDRVREPWRAFVRDALQARDRFGRVVKTARPGPLADRLADVGRRIGHGVEECWRIARQGDALDTALDSLDTQAARQEQAAVRAERVRLRPDDPRAAALERTERALEAQVAAGDRLRRVATDARDRLRVLNAQLDEAVARATELSVSGSAGEADLAASLSSDVDGLVTELEALRQGLEEVGGGRPPTGQ